MGKYDINVVCPYKNYVNTKALATTHNNIVVADIYWNITIEILHDFSSICNAVQWEIIS